ncbi:DUF4065 domain-containing protein [Gluconacetobacter entanii]|uniref:DUF4065 domain-containing protein n=1 Tax=Gluconacetobacter entanii TaxID=108528 RepID=A0ABT3K346_9PROT|nr:type II toxin-antitoxin system antitoxin SocA domain-containing protein [Gluconacetobacter entanii]MCW4589611.1 DUF4065 domain-containing protein [Gluconacetobacter entanii]MCW4593037.1 DUF4065 domain-containing protein [Gluconacetobacter entanii]NPC89183.1 SocA family protein [Gluconacetobacter entanii]
MLSARQVADYFLTLADPDVGDEISNLKLQKLCYYAQGFSLALNDTPLFMEPIVAWQHGPVVESIYHAFKIYGSQGIPCPVGLDFSVYDEDDRELLNEVYDEYGQFSAWKLRNMTHEEAPWRNTDKSGANNVISQSAMKKFFKRRLKD